MKIPFTKGQKGFTLVELMVVVGILAVLMSIVVPAVTGTKSTSIAGQVQSDADATQKAMDNFQNKGVSPSYPEQALATKTSYGLPTGTTLTKKDGVSVITVGSNTTGANQLGTLTDYKGNTVAAYKEIKWDATTKVWQSDGSVNTATFIADFLVKQPASVPLDNDEGIDSLAANTELAEFLWLVKVNNPGSQDESRTLEVYRLEGTNAGGKAAYVQIF